MSLKPYPEYKDSGVEWLGEVPEHWELNRLATTVESTRNGVWGEEPDGLNDVRCVRVADFDRPRQRISDRDVTLRSVSENERNERGLRAGDLLLEKSGGGEKSPVGFVVLYDRPELAVCSNFVARVRLRPGMDSRFWTYVHGFNYDSRLTARSIKQSTGIQNLDEDSYLNETVAVPPFQEQLAVAEFLEWETAEIDAFIADQEALIALLAERRAATISHAVTKGLDPSAPMKGSGDGLAWAGEYPASWQLMALTKVAPHRVDYRGATPEKVDEGVQLITARNVKAGYIDYESSQEFIPAESFTHVMRRGLPEIGDLLFTMEAPLGHAALIDRTDVALAQRVVKFRMGSVAVPKFVLYAINSGYFQYQLALRATGSTAAGIKASKLSELDLLMPPIAEQQAIVDRLDRETVDIDAAIVDAREAIALSKERRAALISAAVTGKIDVRNHGGVE